MDPVVDHVLATKERKYTAYNNKQHWTLGYLKDLGLTALIYTTAEYGHRHFWRNLGQNGSLERR
jgi:hypothetical protein